MTAAHLAAGITGTIYMIHFDERYGHAGHYTGWTTDLPARLAAHTAGTGAKLMEVIKDAGITWRLARTWEGTRNLERSLKRSGGGARRCPICTPELSRLQPFGPENSPTHDPTE
jgi:predicted GIY-YIG superfamily endonuclease